MTLPIPFKLSESSEPAEPSDSGAGDAAPQEFRILDQLPRLVGGLRALSRQINYPESARRAGTEGEVLVSFVVDEQGNVVNPKIEQGIGGGCDEEALRVIRLARFIPGQQKDGVPVKVRIAIPIQFKLGRGYGLRF